MFTSRADFSTCGLIVGLCCAVATAGQQANTPTFSIDWQSPSVGAPDSYWLAPMTPDDILTPAPGGPPLGWPGPGPMPPPGIAYGSPAGPWGPGLGLIMPGGELDALSYGHDDYPMQGQAPDIWHFSVDRYATGVASATPPDVFTEGAAGAMEAEADVFKNWFPSSANNTVWLDGDGMVPIPWGVGLIEAPGVPPTPGIIPNPGDDLDAVDIDTLPHDVSAQFPIYFSLDSGLVDPISGVPNPGAAPANGFSGADILVSNGGVVGVYAPAGALGLDGLGQVPNSDDVDALCLVEDGDGVFNPNNDLLLFSVRRGSSIIGTLDAILGLPIEEGDILIALPGPAPAPGIFVQAEALGLVTARSGGGGAFPWADDLDALDVRQPIPGDTNDDGKIDIQDLTALASNWYNPNPVWWTSGDFNNDGVVDIQDLTALASNWYTVGSPPPDTAPEPATFALLAIGAVALLRSKRS